MAKQKHTQTEEVTHCPITHAPFQDPVVASDGHTYERKAITEWLGKAQTSPITRENISTTLFQNFKVKQIIHILKPEISTQAQVLLRDLHDLELEHLAAEVRSDKDQSYLAGLVPTLIRLQAENNKPTITVASSANAAYHYVVSTANVKTDLPIVVPPMPKYSSDIMHWCDKASGLVNFIATTHDDAVLSLLMQLKVLITHFRNTIKEREKLRMECQKISSNFEKHVPQSAILLCNERTLHRSPEFQSLIDIYFEPVYTMKLLHGTLDEACSKHFRAPT